MNPVNKIYLLFDTVHLLKCIRNNWINQADKTFVYADLHHNSSLKHAFFLSDYFIPHRKDGYLLTWKSLFPNAIERQNNGGCFRDSRTQIIEDARLGRNLRIYHYCTKIVEYCEREKHNKRNPEEIGGCPSHQ